MGGFLGCFGCTKKKKRPKAGNRNASSSSGAHSYVPLDSDATLKLDCDEGHEAKQEHSADLMRDKPKESAAAKIKKKVSFNLNLRTYEPIPNEESSSCYDEEETAGSSIKYLNYEDDDPLPSKKGSSFPANHRYANCAYEEDDEEFEDSDEDEDELDFEEEDFAEEDFDPDYSRMRQVVEAEPNVRKRREFVSSVLNPVQNLSQWKEVKATSKQQLRLQKENVMQEMPPSQIQKSGSLPNNFHPSPEIAVDSSLSSWLVSSRSC